MTERRPFPPSPRRLALARAAGVTAASPLVVGAAACSAALLAAVMLAREASTLVGGWIEAACRAAGSPAPELDAALHGTSALPADAALHGTSALPANAALHGTSALPADAALHAAPAAHGMPSLLGLDHVIAQVAELAAPLLVAAALAALVAHVAQTRALWFPRRRVAGAPVVPPARLARTALDIVAASVIGVVAFGWLWLTAPRLAQLFAIDAAPAPGHYAPTLAQLLAIDAAPAPGSSALATAPAAIGSALASLVVTVAIAWVALAVLDALVRRAQLAGALAMTTTEKREDDRLAAADPRWRALRDSLARGPSASPAVARAALVLLGDDIAVALAWDPRRQPIPVRTITGRRARATQLLGLARRHRVAVHRDAQLAAALVDGDGPVPAAHWARLAEIIAAVQASHTGPDLSR